MILGYFCYNPKMILERVENHPSQVEHSNRHIQVERKLRWGDEVTKKDILELERITVKTERWVRDCYDILPQDHPLNQQLYRILRSGKNGIGLLEKNVPEPRHIFVCIAESEFAYALGSDIYLSTGFINILTTEDRRAGILKHETRHIQAQHVLRSKKSMEKHRKNMLMSLQDFSLPRLHEMDAEVSVPLDLRAAGYDPREYYKLAREILPSAIDDAHGSKFDRLGIIRIFLKSEEMELDDVVPTPNPKDLETFPVAESRPEQILYLLRIKKFDEARKIVEVFSDSGLIKLLKIVERVFWKEEERNFFPFVGMYTVVVKECERRSKLQLESSNKVWNLWVYLLRYETFSLETLKEIEDAVFNSKSKSVPLLATDLLKTLTTPDKMIEFTQFFANSAKGFPESDQFISNFSNFIDRSWKGSFSNAELTFFETWVRSNNLREEFFEVDKTALVPLKKLEYEGDDSEKSLSVTRKKGRAPIRYKPKYKVIIDFYQHIGQILSEASPGKKYSSLVVAKQFLANYSSMSVYLRKKRLEELDPARYDRETRAYLEEHEDELLGQIVQDMTLLKTREFLEEEGADRNFIFSMNNFRNDLHQHVNSYFGSINRKELSAKFDKWFNVLITNLYPSIKQLVEIVDSENYTDLPQLLDEEGLKTIERFITYSPTTVIKEKRESFVTAIKSWMYQNKDVLNQKKDLSDYFWKSRIPEPLFQCIVPASNEVLTYVTDDVTYFYVPEDLIILEEIHFIDKLWDARHEQAEYYERILEVLNSTEVQNISQTGKLLLLGYIFELIKNRSYNDEVDRSTKHPLLKLLSHPFVIHLRDQYTSLLNKGFPEIEDRLSEILELRSRLEDSHRKSFSSPVTEIDTFLFPLQEQCFSELALLDLEDLSREQSEKIRLLLPLFFERVETVRMKFEEDRRILSQLSFSEALDYLQRLIDDKEVNLEAVDMLQEDSLKNQQDLTLFEAFWFQNRTKLITEGYRPVGLAMMADRLTNTFSERDAIDLFKAAVSSRFDDTDLKAYIAPLWFAKGIFDMNSYSAVNNQKYQLKISKSNNQEAVFDIQGNVESFTFFDEFCAQFYASFSQVETRYVAFRLLFSQNGLLTTQKGRRELAKFIREDGMESSSDPQLARLAKTLINVILEIDSKQSDVKFDPLSISEPLLPLLAEQLFLPPQTQGTLEKAAVSVVHPVEFYIYKTYKAGDEIPRTSYEKEAYFKKYGIHYGEEPKLTQSDIQKLLSLTRSDIPSSQRVSSLSDELEEMAEKMKNRIRARYPVTKVKRIFKPLTPARSLIAFGESKGTLGNRFVQLYGITGNVSSEYKKQFRHSYESVRGQLKFAAMRTIRRAAEKDDAHDNLKLFWLHLKAFISERKGGSTATLYRSVMDNGLQLATKVIVPNAEHFVDETKQEVLMGLAQMKARYPFHKYAFNRIEDLINDLALWAHADLSEVDNLEGDRVYREHFNNFAVDEGFRLVIPQSYETGTNLVKLEDWFEGQSLFDFYPNANWQDRKRLKDLIIVHNDAQMSEVQADGVIRVHSNMHPSQYLAAYNAEMSSIDVALLDRALYLTFQPEEQQFFSFITGKNGSSESASNFIQFLLETSDTTKSFNARHLRNAEKLITNRNGSLDQTLEFCTEVRKSLKIPFKWVLLQQNQVFLNSLVSEILF